MSQADKRKNTFKQPSSKRKCKHSCVVHVPGITHGNFTSFRNVKGSANDKLQYLLEVKEKRLNEPHDSPHRKEVICEGIPSTLDNVDLDTVGYHQQCYKRFISYLDRLKKFNGTAPEPCTSRSPRKVGNSCPIFPAVCIFCGKSRKQLKKQTDPLIPFVSWKNKPSSWEEIEPRALALGNNQLYRQVKDVDLFSAEAQYHATCRNTFNTEYNNHMRAEERAMNKNEEGLETEHDQKISAHENALSKVIGYVDDHILKGKEVVQLSSLLLMYINELEISGFPNVNYRSEKLMSRLQSHAVGEKIAFTKVSDKGCISFYLVYSSSITLADAVTVAYKLGSTDKYEDVAFLLRSLILRAFIQSEALPWPPTADDLEADAILPTQLTHFLNIVLSGKVDLEQKCAKTKRLVLSIGQVCGVSPCLLALECIYYLSYIQNRKKHFHYLLCFIFRICVEQLQRVSGSYLSTYFSAAQSVIYIAVNS